LEFFASPEAAEKLFAAFEKDEDITYYAITSSGDLFTNVYTDTANAVTWGSFPGKEIVQPTVVEKVSFEAWKVSFASLYFVIVVADDHCRTRLSSSASSGPTSIRQALTRTKCSPKSSRPTT
jgi:ABC-type uncharacterized transport system involved in gliding motility auxiliary subunit